MYIYGVSYRDPPEAVEIQESDRDSAGVPVTFTVSAKNVEHSVNFGDDAAPTEQAAALTFEPLDASRVARAAELHRTRAAAAACKWPTECYVERGDEFHLFLESWLNRWVPYCILFCREECRLHTHDTPARYTVHIVHMHCAP